MQKAHLHEHNYEKKGDGRAWGIVPHYGFVALGATRHALLRAPGHEQVFNRLPAAGQSQAAATGMLQACKVTTKYQVSGEEGRQHSH